MSRVSTFLNTIEEHNAFAVDARMKFKQVSLQHAEEQSYRMRRRLKTLRKPEQIYYAPLGTTRVMLSHGYPNVLVTLDGRPYIPPKEKNQEAAPIVFCVSNAGKTVEAGDTVILWVETIKTKNDSERHYLRMDVLKGIHAKKARRMTMAKINKLRVEVPRSIFSTSITPQRQGKNWEALRGAMAQEGILIDDYNPGIAGAKYQSWARSELHRFEHKLIPYLEDRPKSTRGKRFVEMPVPLHFEWGLYPRPPMSSFDEETQNRIQALTAEKDGTITQKGMRTCVKFTGTSEAKEDHFIAGFMRLRSDKKAHELVCLVTPSPGIGGEPYIFRNVNVDNKERIYDPLTVKNFQSPYLAWILRQDVLTGRIEKPLQAYRLAGVVIPGENGEEIPEDPSIKRQSSFASFFGGSEASTSGPSSSKKAKRK